MSPRHGGFPEECVNPLHLNRLIFTLKSSQPLRKLHCVQSHRVTFLPFTMESYHGLGVKDRVEIPPRIEISAVPLKSTGSCVSPGFTRWTLNNSQLTVFLCLLWMPGNRRKIYFLLQNQYETTHSGMHCVFSVMFGVYIPVEYARTQYLQKQNHTIHVLQLAVFCFVSVYIDTCHSSCWLHYYSTIQLDHNLVILPRIDTHIVSNFFLISKKYFICTNLTSSFILHFLTFYFLLSQFSALFYHILCICVFFNHFQLFLEEVRLQKTLCVVVFLSGTR